MGSLCVLFVLYSKLCGSGTDKSENDSAELGNPAEASVHSKDQPAEAAVELDNQPEHGPDRWSTLFLFSLSQIALLSLSYIFPLTQVAVQCTS